MRFLKAVVLAAIVFFVPAGAAFAEEAPPDYVEAVTSYDATYTFDADGVAHVHLEFTYNFAGYERHGPFLTFATRQTYGDGQDRTYEFSNFTASSPTGAPAGVNLEYGKYWVDVKIGDPDIGNITGVQKYIVDYTISGITQPHVEEGETLYDEVYFNPITDWTVPVYNISIAMSAPADAVAVGCYSGAYSTTTYCDQATVDGGAAIFTQGRVDAYAALSVDVLWPLGTMNTAVHLRPSSDLAYAFSVTPFTGGAAAAIFVGGVFALSRKIRGEAVDEQYAGFTPGLGPTGTDAARIVKRDYHSPVAVQFSPPPGMRPGQLGTLIDERADVRDVTATLVDLAVRGYMRIDDVAEASTKRAPKPKYQLVKLRDADDALVAYEKTLFNALFSTGDEVLLDDIKTTFASDLATVQTNLYKNVTDLRWFRRNPNTARLAWGSSGFFLIIVGVAATWFTAAAGPWALIPLPLVVLGVMRAVTAKNAPARTAEGTKVLAQAQGFKLFLETADGNKLRYEEGRDIFSMYLPFAIAFDVADKWTKTFEKLAAQGKAIPDPTWYTGNYPIWVGPNSFSNQVSSFTSLADSAMRAPTPGSSGGSGFSGGSFGGGGGFSGGGSSGGGGGSW